MYCTVLRMEAGVFFKELRREGGKGSEGLASHTFADLVPLRVIAECHFPWSVCWVLDITGKLANEYSVVLSKDS